jgi:uncharacterized flavoprotein (TIGR03862 family)
LDVYAEYGDVVSAEPLMSTSPRAGKTRNIAIIGAGPAGLFAAECLAASGHHVTVYERMPTPARKFLMAGRGGLNLTHSEPIGHLLARYGKQAAPIIEAIEAFPPSKLIDWVHGLGIETFTGSSGRVFPKAMKASPLLRAWLKRLAEKGVIIATRRTWMGFSPDGTIQVAHPNGEIESIAADAVVLALGGGSWPKLGSDGAWAGILHNAGVAVSELEASNAGVLIPWSEIVKSRFQGMPLKRIAVEVDGRRIRGEAVITSSGLEGGAIYALSREIRNCIAAGTPALTIDLRPDIDLAGLTQRLGQGNRKDSLANVLRKFGGLSPAGASLVREAYPTPSRDPATLAAQIKSIRLRISGIAGLERAISTAGGVSLEAIDEKLMLRALQGVFIAGEMLDWDAPTGGYLLQASFSTAAAAAAGVTKWLEKETQIHARSGS